MYPVERVVSTAKTYGLLGITTASSSYPLYLAGTGGEVAYVDNSGALYVHNGVHSFARTRGGYGVESYTPRSAHRRSKTSAKADFRTDRRSCA